MGEFTPAAMAVVRQAQREAQRLGYPFIQREQLFLGLLQDGAVGQILGSLSIEPQAIAQELEERLGPGMGAPDTVDDIELLPTADQVFRHRAQTAAVLLGHTQIGPEEILLGFLLEQHGMIAELFRNRSITPEHVIEAIKRIDR